MRLMSDYKRAQRSQVARLVDDQVFQHFLKAGGVSHKIPQGDWPTECVRNLEIEIIVNVPVHV